MAETARVVGLLGGSFDPVHYGHLALAEHALRRLELERMLLLLTATPPHKRSEKLAPVADREAMLRLALEGREGLELCALDLDPARVHYTIDTLRALRDGEPPCRPVFVLGMDSLLEIDTWKDYRSLLAEFDLAVMDRPRSRLRDLRPRVPPEAARRLVEPRDRGGPRPGGGGRIFHLRVEPVAVSSTEVRARAAAGRSLERLVPPGVAEYIRVSGIYRD